MKLVLVLLAMTCLGGAPAWGAEASKVTYYVQLVRGSDEAKPPAPDSKPIGPKLSSRFRPVFRWEHYWEMSRQEVRLAHGQTAKVDLNKERSVEISLSPEGTRKVTAFCKGKAVSTLTRPAGAEMTILGGDREGKTGWFIVVRRDRPTVE
jgi:hypothetical protein